MAKATATTPKASPSTSTTAAKASTTAVATAAKASATTRREEPDHLFDNDREDDLGAEAEFGDHPRPPDNVLDMISDEAAAEAAEEEEPSSEHESAWTGVSDEDDLVIGRGSRVRLRQSAISRTSG